MIDAFCISACGPQTGRGEATQPRRAARPSTRTTAWVAASLFSLAGAVLAGDVHWGYAGPIGPEHWGSLSPEFAVCASGRNESPVNIVHAIEAELPPLAIDYRPGGGEVVNNGHTLQVNYASGSTLVLDGHTYELKQFHFHAPSENQVDGKSFALEGHLVHADADGALAVVAVLYEPGAENAALAAFWDQLPAKAGGKARLATPVDAASLLPAGRDYYRYNGSLTTPPCSEGVVWLVMKEPASVSEPQVAAFSAALGGTPNNRPVQPLHARVVLQ